MKLEFLCEYQATLKAGVPVGDGPMGTRTVIDITGGSFTGPKMNGRLLPSGADWLLIRPDGTALLDVRSTFETDDGAYVYVQYFGIVELTDKVQEVLQGSGETQYGDQRFFNQPRFETGDTRYQWLNTVVAAGEGRLLSIDGAPAVEYRVFQLVND